MQLVYDKKERRWLPYEEKAEKPKAKTEDKPARKKAATPRNKSRTTANK